MGKIIWINQSRDEREEVIRDTSEAQTILSAYYKQVQAIKLENLDQMDTFLESYALPRLNYKEVENLNRSLQGH